MRGLPNLPVIFSALRAKSPRTTTLAPNLGGYHIAMFGQDQGNLSGILSSAFMGVLQHVLWV